MGTRSLTVVLGAALAAGAFLLGEATTVRSQQEREYVGADLCAECHADQWERFEGSVHEDALEYLADAPQGIGGCEACHGPGSLHVELAGIEEPGFLTAIDASPDPDGCYACHQGVQSQFALPERHPVRQGFMSCSDCHDPHASFQPGLQRSALNGSCTDCHADKAGPWVFPHPVQEVEGCVACHQPHGSVNPHMLPYREVTFTCLSCHTATPGFHVLPDFSECTACHVQIHGSNVDPAFLQ